MKPLKFSEAGIATLEATLMIPLITIMMFSLLSLSAFLYHKYVMLDAAVYVAEQRAFLWSDRSRDLESGVKTNNSTDGLYWRLFNDSPQDQLVAQKKSLALSSLQKNLQQGFLPGDFLQQKVGYEKRFFTRTVTVDISKRYRIRDIFVSPVTVEPTTAAARSEVIEPAEFVRNCKLGANYLSELLANLKNQETEGDPNEGQTKPQEGVYASSKSNVNGQKLYHYTGCGFLAQIKPENLISFVSEEEAQKQGYHICLVCAKTRQSTELK